MAWRPLGQRRDGERGGKRGDGDGLDVLEPEGLGVGEDEADGSGREPDHSQTEGVRAVERRLCRPTAAAQTAAAAQFKGQFGSNLGRCFWTSYGRALPRETGEERGEGENRHVAMQIDT